MGRQALSSQWFRRVPAAILVLLGTVCCACASHTHLPYRASPLSDSAATAGRFEASGEYAYVRSPVAVDNHVLSELETARYEVRRLRFPSVGDNGQPEKLVTVDLHQTTLPGRWPAVVVLPIWGSYTYPSRKITGHLKRSSNGTVHVLNVQGESHLIDWAGLAAAPDEETFTRLWEEGARRERIAVVDVRRLIDWAESHPDIDATRIGLIGFSHGAIVAGVAVTQEPRLAATILVMGGAHPHEIIARCDGQRTESIQLMAMESFGWDQDELEARLEPVFRTFDSANYPGRVDPSEVLIFEAGTDRCVPDSAREALWLAMGRPERYTIHADHHRAFYSMTPLAFNWLRRRVWDFFERKLVQEPLAQ